MNRYIVIGAGWVLIILLALGLEKCRDDRSEDHGAAKQAVKDQQAVVARTDTLVIRDTVRLAAATRIVTKTLTNWDTVSKSDTVTVERLIEAGDTLAAACSEYVTTCQQTTARLLQLRLDHQELERRYQKLVQTPRPRRRWGLGCVGGYGAVVSRGSVRVGPGASCGVAFSF